MYVGLGAVRYPHDYRAPTRLGSGDRRRQVARESGQSAHGRRVGAHQRHCWRRRHHGGHQWRTRAGILGRRRRRRRVAARPALPLPCRGRYKGPRALRISATGTVARDACVAMIISHCYVHIHLSPSSVGTTVYVPATNYLGAQRQRPNRRNPRCTTPLLVRSTRRRTTRLPWDVGPRSAVLTLPRSRASR